jgi:hypothetical protein
MQVFSRQSRVQGETTMPQAFSVAYGLDLNTEISSFWAWLHDAQAILAGTGDGNAQVRQTVESQRDHIDRQAREQSDPELARFALTIAVGLVGFHYASNQKLLNGLRDFGLLETELAAGVFDTIAEASLEESGPE